MASYQTPVIHATHDVLAVTDYNSVASNTTFLYQRPYAAYYNSVTTACANTSATQVTLGGTTASGYGFSVSSNNVIVPLTATYWVSFCVNLGTANSGTLNSGIWHNGSVAFSGGTATFNSSTGALSSGAGILSCSAGDTVALYVGYQSSGGSLNTTTGATNTYIHIMFGGSQ